MINVHNVIKDSDSSYKTDRVDRFCQLLKKYFYREECRGKIVTVTNVVFAI